jgi:lysophospholipase L1-like esterase
MSQYKTGTATFTNGSATVAGTGTAWLTNLSAGQWIARNGATTATYETYIIGGVVSDTELTLTAPYGGTTATDVSYVVHKDFSPDGAPIWANGDIEFASISNEWNRRTPSKDTTVTIVQSVADLFGLTGVSGQQLSVTSRNQGELTGGGKFVYLNLAKSLHDGKRYYSPTVPWNLDPDTYNSAVGETDPSGSGIWHRLDTIVTSADIGITGLPVDPAGLAVKGGFKWSDDPSVVSVRHKYLAEKIVNASASTLPNGFCIGNSIMQGTGSSSISNTIPFLLANKLYAYNSVGLVNDWAPANRGVGGSNTTLGLMYVADNSDNATFTPEGGLLKSDRDYCLIMTLRNDVGQLTIDESYSSVSRVLASLNNSGVEPIFITDPPKIDISTGEILDTQANFGDWYDRALIACGSADVTVVDCWKYFNELKNVGVDLRDYTADGIHPNDAGFEIISEMVFQAMTARSDAKTTTPANQTAVESPDFVSVYDALGGTVTTTTTIAGLVTSSTARQAQTGEVTDEAFVLADGDTVRFQAPGPVQAIIVDLLGGASGTVSAQFNFVNVGSAMGAEAGTVRESSHLIQLVKTVTPHNKNGYVQLTSTGTTRVLGVTFLCERQSIRTEKWVDANEVGTWSDSTLSTGIACRQSSTVTDYAELYFYGSFAVLDYARGSSFGKFKWSIDGGSETEVDCYLNAPESVTDIELDLETNTWHTIKLEVTAKNAASSANTVKFGNIRKSIAVTTPDVDYIALDAGDSVDTRVKYKAADVVKVISGSPRAYDGLNGTTFTLNGSGAAVVRLSK